MTTFPSELIQPYQADTTNYLVVALINAGVGIYVSDDNLTTVTNIVDGSAGVPSDITLNERSAALGNYRIGYDYSALTVAEKAALDDDPWQVGKTNEDAIKDYKFVQPESTPNGETVTLVAGTANSKDFVLHVKFKSDNQYNTASPKVLGNTVDALSINGTTGELALLMSYSQYTFTLAESIRTNPDRLIDVKIVYNNGNINAYQDGAALAETRTSTKGFTFPAECFPDSESFEGYSIYYQSNDFPADSRFYDFNQPTGTTNIPELINGQHGTFTNFVSDPYQYVVPRTEFADTDYATLTLFQNAENGNTGLRVYKPASTAGATLTNFVDGVIVDGGTVTSPITVSTTGDCHLKNATLDDVTVSGATGDVYIDSCEVENVTG